MRRTAEHLAQRRGDVGRAQQAARDLVQQRREQVVVVPVDEHDVDRLVAQLPGALEPAEAGADDHDPGRALVHRSPVYGRTARRHESARCRIGEVYYLPTSR